MFLARQIRKTNYKAGQRMLFSDRISYYIRSGGNSMHITNDIKPVTYLKARAAELLDQINNTHRPVIITQNGEPRAVLQDPKSYEEMRNTLGLLKLLAVGESDIRGERSRPQEEVFTELENLLKKRGHEL